MGPLGGRDWNCSFGFAYHHNSRTSGSDDRRGDRHLRDGPGLLDRRGPTLTQSRTLRLVAEIETNHVLAVQFALQVDQADAVTNGFYLLCHNPNTHYQQLAFLLKTRNRGASNTDHRNEVDLEILLAHLLLDIDESRLRHRF